MDSYPGRKSLETNSRQRSGFCPPKASWSFPMVSSSARGKVLASERADNQRINPPLGSGFYYTRQSELSTRARLDRRKMGGWLDDQVLHVIQNILHRKTIIRGRLVFQTARSVLQHFTYDVRLIFLD